MTLRAKLREALTKRFVPELKRRGFTGPDRIGENSLCHDFVRNRGDKIERLCVQFEKRQKPRFILNVWAEMPHGAGDPKEVPLLHGRISPGRGFDTGSWFRADVPWWRQLLGRSSSCEEAAVDQVIARLDAIDEWFQNPRDTEVVRLLSPLPIESVNKASREPSETTTTSDRAAG